MAAYLSPLCNEPQGDSNGSPLSGGKLYTYLAGSSTPAATYTDSTGLVAQANPVVLNSRGVPANPVWLGAGVSYKFVLKDATGVTLAPTFDNVRGINDPAATTSPDQWVALGITPTYLSATSFSVPGDRTANLQVGRRIKAIVTLGTAYGSILTSAFAAGVTTVVLTMDSPGLSLDSGLSAVSYGLLSAESNSLPYINTPFSTAQTAAGALTRSVLGKLREWVSLDDFTGADRTGTTSSVTAMSNALATGKDVLLIGGTWKLDGNIVAANLGRQRILGIGGATLSVSLAGSTDVFTMNGPVSLENLTIELNNGPCRYVANYAASIGKVVLRDLKVQNLKDMDNTTGSIPFRIVCTGNTFDIDGVQFSSILKKGNGTITDTAGSLNCIFIGGGTGAVQGSIRNVYASEVHNIDATSAVIYEDTSVIYLITDSSDAANQVAINNVQGLNFGKRLLKIQATNVSVDDIVGYSATGDTLGVIGFLDGGVGDSKTGCSARNVRAYGAMDTAFASSMPGVKWKNMIAYTTPGTKSGMLGASFGLLINGDDTDVEGFESGSQRHIGLGSSSQIVKNTKLRSLKLVFNSTVGLGIQNISSTIGFDGLKIEGVRCVVDGTFPSGSALIATDLYLNGTTIKGRNVTLRDVTVESTGPAASYGIYIKYCENVTLEDYRYINTSGLTHFQLAILESCVNVKVDGVLVEGANTIGVFLKNCTGRSSVDSVVNTGATTAAVFCNNSTSVRVNDCDPASVGWTTINVAVNGALIGSKVFDPASLAAGATQQTTVTVTGAVVGNRAVAAFSLANADILWMAQVTAADTVTVTQWNRGAGAVDLGSGTLTASVFNE